MTRRVRFLSSGLAARGLASAVAAAVSVISVVAVPRVARADTPPSAWDFARDPAAHERWALHVRVEQLLRTHNDGPPGLRIEDNRELRVQAALALLEGADAASSPDVRLRFDLGTTYFELAEVTRSGVTGDLRYYAKAAATLRGAIDAAPDDPSVNEALDDLAVSYARLGRAREELETWRRYIPRIVDPRIRAADEMNMAEAEMRLGHVDDAIATLQEVLRECAEFPDSSSTYTLTLWDLAVAEDRSGDPRGALETATKAAHMTAISSRGAPMTGIELLTSDEAVFFVPVWEVHWYKALAATAMAREDADPREALGFWVQAEAEWTKYIDAASAPGAGDHWLAIAKLRHDRIKVARVAANKRMPKGARRPVGADDP
jgi:tetratricopeptide (TPR) repeat protein